MIYCFTYSSTMSHKEFFALCPGADFIGPAELSGYMLMFDGYSPARKGAIANIESSGEDEVWGGLFEISEDHLAALDAHIGYPRFSNRTLMKVKSASLGKKVDAWVYHHESLAEGMPSHDYIKTLLDGARDCRLPAAYVFDWIGPYARVSDRPPRPAEKGSAPKFTKFQDLS